MSDIQLHTDSNEISIKGKKIKLTPKEMGVLEMLIDYDGKTVARTDLLEKVWEDIYGNDQGITQSISKLRKIFSDCEGVSIITVPKKGYQLRIKNQINSLSPSNKKLRFQPFALVLLLLLSIIFFLVFIQPIGIRIDFQ